MTLDVNLIAARWRLCRLPSSEIPSVAVQALVDGHDGPALRELSGESQPIMSEVREPFERALRELRAPDLSDREAALLLARSLCEQIAAGSLRPYTGARRIWDLDIQFPGAGHELDRFAELADEFEESRTSEEMERCERSIVELAAEYIGS